MRPGDQLRLEREMTQGSRYSRAVHLVTSAASAVGMMGWERSDSDPDGLRFLARTCVWARWCTLVFGLLWVYRPEDSLETYAPYVPGFLLYLVLNGYTHYRLATKKTVTRGWILANGMLDVVILSIAVALSGGFSSSFIYLLHYPQLAGYAMILTSFWLTMAGATFVAAPVSCRQLDCRRRHRHCCGGGADPARPDWRHVCGGRTCQCHRQVRASEVEAGRRARARPAA